MNIYISKDIEKRLRTYAASSDQSMSSIIAKALDQFIPIKFDVPTVDSKHLVKPSDPIETIQLGKSFFAPIGGIKKDKGDMPFE